MESISLIFLSGCIAIQLHLRLCRALLAPLNIKRFEPNLCVLENGSEEVGSWEREAGSFFEVY
jgi:hypothetical protein